MADLDSEASTQGTSEPSASRSRSRALSHDHALRPAPRPKARLASDADAESDKTQVTSEESSPSEPEPLRVQKKPARRGRPKAKQARSLKPSAEPKAADSDSEGTQHTSQSASPKLSKPLPRKRRASASHQSSASGSSETKRIQEAQRVWDAPPAKKPKKTMTPASELDSLSTSSDLEETTLEPTPLPATSGMFDYCMWMLQMLSPDDRERAALKWWETYAEFCAGMGTGLMCFEGLRRAMATYFLNVDAACTCFTEKVPWKALVLAEIGLTSAAHDLPPTTFKTTGDILKIPRKDIGGAVVLEPPSFKLLIQGIECNDISAISTTPKSVMDTAGSSGKSLQEMLAVLESLRFEDRPEGIILECVRRLMQKRLNVGTEPEVGTELVSKALRRLGYVGSWCAENSTEVYLPASRPRTWGIFLKVVQSGPNPLEAERKRWEDVSRAHAIVKALKVPKHEPLRTVIERLGRAQMSDTLYKGGKLTLRREEFILHGGIRFASLVEGPLSEPC
jgi:site-specific DNA-cytosine methylase